MTRTGLLIAGAILVAALCLYLFANQAPAPVTAGPPLVAVVVPELTSDERVGEAA
jgi:hypothetical protein